MNRVNRRRACTRDRARTVPSTDQSSACSDDHQDVGEGSRADSYDSISI